MSTDKSKIKQVIETTSLPNKHLAEGWVILAVAEGKDEYGAPTVKYSLGHEDEKAPKSFYY